jgi:NAD(P)-dependent dehydrogenase (short-subunit alcohol dehydrogenase family)
MVQDNPSRGFGLGAFFANRKVVVTGASSGIGYDVALAFGERGAKVALLARRKELLSELADKIRQAGGVGVPIACDVTKRQQVQHAIDESNKALGGIDILVNSAGILLPSKFEEMKPPDLKKMLDVNLFGTVYAMQAVLPLMRKAGRGSIVNIASLAGRRGISPLGGYCSTKFAVTGLSEALRTELFGSGINVSLVMPGLVDTPMVTEALQTPGQGFKDVPPGMTMPPRWVTWAVFAAIALRLPEVDVPPGAGTAEKVAALFPGATDALLSIGSRMMELVTSATRRPSQR